MLVINQCENIKNDVLHSSIQKAIIVQDYGFFCFAKNMRSNIGNDASKNLYKNTARSLLIILKNLLQIFQTKIKPISKRPETTDDLKNLKKLKKTFAKEQFRSS